MTVWLPVLLLAGPVIIGIGIWEAAHRHRLQREGNRTDGLVVRHHKTKGLGKTTNHFAVVNFVDAQGNRHEFQANVSGVEGLPVGRHAPVIYLPGNPKNARLDIASKRLWSIVLPLMIGITFTAVAIWMFSRGR